MGPAFDDFRGEASAVAAGFVRFPEFLIHTRPELEAGIVHEERPVLQADDLRALPPFERIAGIHDQARRASTSAS